MSFRILPLLLCFACLAPVGADALVRPVESSGDFRAQLDVYERERGDGRVDVIVLISVPNSEVSFGQIWGEGLQGRIESRLSLETEGGGGVARTDGLELRALRPEDAFAPTMYQVFALTLEDVAAQYGDLVCELVDVGRGDAGDPSQRRALLETEWVRGPRQSEVRGLHLHPPLFLSGAPLKVLPSKADGTPPPRRAALAAHLHPGRRYGVEQERLQVTFDIESGAGGAAALPRRLLMQVMARDLDFAHRDTLLVIEDPAAFVAAGGHAAVTWELDVNELPPGAYQLSCAPLDGFGGSWIAEFDVIWSLEALDRPTPGQWLLGHLVLQGKALDEFKAAGPAEREALLAQFWSDHDPDPSTRVNEAELEFRRRMRHVHRDLGGFGKSRALDDRGWIYLLLGPPDEIDRELLPANEDSFDSALDKVFDAWAPIKTGFQDRIVRPDADDTATQAVRERLRRATSLERFKAWELWSYAHKGESLFPNAYSDLSLGGRFLFVAKLGGSVYVLDQSSSHERGSIDH